MKSKKVLLIRIGMKKKKKEKSVMLNKNELVSWLVHSFFLQSPP